MGFTRSPAGNFSLFVGNSGELVLLIFARLSSPMHYPVAFQIGLCIEMMLSSFCLVLRCRSYLISRKASVLLLPEKHNPALENGAWLGSVSSRIHVNLVR
jgi:hypothetical protein